MGRRRSNVIDRKRFMGPREDVQPDPLSDEADVAAFLLQKGYRTAMAVADEQHKRLQDGSDKEGSQRWHLVKVWIKMLGNK